MAGPEASAGDEATDPVGSRFHSLKFQNVKNPWSTLG